MKDNKNAARNKQAWYMRERPEESKSATHGYITKKSRTPVICT
jgi:hypothetical protein